MIRLRYTIPRCHTTTVLKVYAATTFYGRSIALVAMYSTAAKNTVAIGLKFIVRLVKNDVYMQPLSDWEV